MGAHLVQLPLKALTPRLQLQVQLVLRLPAAGGLCCLSLQCFERCACCGSAGVSRLQTLPS